MISIVWTPIIWENETPHLRGFPCLMVELQISQGFFAKNLIHLSTRVFTIFRHSLLGDKVLHKEAWVAKLLGTHLSIQVHKKVKFSCWYNSPLALKGLVSRYSKSCGTSHLNKHVDIRCKNLSCIIASRGAIKDKNTRFLHFLAKIPDYKFRENNTTSQNVVEKNTKNCFELITSDSITQVFCF